MTEVTPPIIVTEDDDIGIYPSAAEMVRHVEAIDVQAGIYLFYDSRGCPLDASVRDDESIQLVLSVRSCDEQYIRRLIGRHFRDIGLDRMGLRASDVDGLDLRQLLHRYLEWASSHGYRS